jgi:hypothetical protein
MIQAVSTIRRHFFADESDDYRLALALSLLAYELKETNLRTKACLPLLETLIDDYKRDYEAMQAAVSRSRKRFEAQKRNLQ